VAVAVIEEFEPIDIDQEQSQGCLAARGSPPFFVERVIESAAVGDAGEWIYHREPPQLRLILHQSRIEAAAFDQQHDEHEARGSKAVGPAHVPADVEPT